jgi:hypothetical protein
MVDATARTADSPTVSTTTPSVATSGKGIPMNRYLVERTFVDGLSVPTNDDGAKAMLGVVEGNAAHGVTWVHSYVNPERTATFCIYDGPSPEAIRLAAKDTGLPVDKITEVRVLDPYFYH